MPTANHRERKESCPLCGRPAMVETRPFCSQGCRDRDLLNWLGDSYRVPGEPVREEDDQALDSGR